MNEYKDTKFLKELQAVLSVPEMQSEFDARLEKQLSKNVQTRTDNQSQRIYFKRWAVALPAFVILGLVIIVAAVGPQTVLASIRSLDFLPGFGYVEGAVRTLEEPVSQTQAGITAEVFEGVSDSNKTWVRINIDNIGDQDIDQANECNIAPYLMIGDEIISHEWTSILSKPETLLIESSFTTQLDETGKATLVIPCLPISTLESNLEEWSFDLHFVPVSDENTPLPVEPVYLPTEIPNTTQTRESNAEETTDTTEMEEKLDVQIVVDSVVELENGYQFKGDILVPGYQEFQFNVEDLEFSDTSGEIIETKPAEGPIGGDSSFGLNSWLIQTTTKDLPEDLTVSLNAISLPVNDETVTSSQIELNLGTDPQIGQEWEINETINVDDFDVEFLNVQLKQLGPEMFMLSFEIHYAKDEINNLDLADKDIQEEINFGGGGGGPNIQIKTIGYNSLPTGIRTIYVSKAWLVDNSGWSTTISMP